MILCIKELEGENPNKLMNLIYIHKKIEYPEHTILV